MTCKECIHSEVCKYRYRPLPLSDCTYDESNDVERIGCPFVDKAKFVELPCKIGTKIYDISELLMPQCYSPEMYIFNADDICISKDSRGFIFTIDGNDYRYEDFGKSVFFSKEEAFAKLKECENNA